MKTNVFIENMMKRMALIVALLVMSFVSGYAQEPSQVEKAVNEIVNKYDGTNGVECVTVTKGSGLGMLKKMFNKQFGKNFMRGVTSITIINYSEAPEEVCQALRKEFDAFISLLEEFNLGEEKSFSDNEYIRCFAASSAPRTLSDFIIALENKDAKALMYMAGEIKVEENP